MEFSPRSRMSPVWTRCASAPAIHASGSDASSGRARPRVAGNDARARGRRAGRARPRGGAGARRRNRRGRGRPRRGGGRVGAEAAHSVAGSSPAASAPDAMGTRANEHANAASARAAGSSRARAANGREEWSRASRVACGARHARGRRRSAARVRGGDVSRVLGPRRDSALRARRFSSKTSKSCSPADGMFKGANRIRRLFRTGKQSEGKPGLPSPLRGGVGAREPPRVAGVSPARAPRDSSSGIAPCDERDVPSRRGVFHRARGLARDGNSPGSRPSRADAARDASGRALPRADLHLRGAARSPREPPPPSSRCCLRSSRSTLARTSSLTKPLFAPSVPQLAVPAMRGSSRSRGAAGASLRTPPQVTDRVANRREELQQGGPRRTRVLRSARISASAPSTPSRWSWPWRRSSPSRSRTRRRTRSPPSPRPWPLLQPRRREASAGNGGWGRTRGGREAPGHLRRRRVKTAATTLDSAARRRDTKRLTSPGSRVSVPAIHISHVLFRFEQL